MPDKPGANAPGFHKRIGFLYGRFHRGPGVKLLTWMYILIGNLPFILIQRYNRPRLLHLLKRMDREEMSVTVITVLMILICMSTVFLKKHSILDVIAAIPITLIAYWSCYGRKKHAQTL